MCRPYTETTNQPLAGRSRTAPTKRGACAAGVMVAGRGGSRRGASRTVLAGGVRWVYAGDGYIRPAIRIVSRRGGSGIARRARGIPVAMALQPSFHYCKGVM